ncbi:hypothetical protein MRB53_039879 [Persea americana]|nr:hypothetical protein MRB53_039879 [Persea americana]
MRSWTLLPVLLAFVSFFTLCHAWSKEDHEIFTLRDAVVTNEGADTTFYQLLNITSSATQKEVEQALKKRSRQLHPDKAIPSLLALRSKPSAAPKGGKKPGVRVQKGPTQKERDQITKQATDRYARFNQVAAILRNKDLRERYDHFLRHGFPRWRGTGYYYERFRPGLATVLFGLLLVFGGAAHYGAMYLSYKRQREFVQRYISQARKTAWSNENGFAGIPTGPVEVQPPPAAPMEEQAMPMNRRQKRMQEKDSKKEKSNPRAARTARKQGVSTPVEAEPMTGPSRSEEACRIPARCESALVVAPSKLTTTARRDRRPYHIPDSALPPTHLDVLADRRQSAQVFDARITARWRSDQRNANPPKTTAKHSSTPPRQIASTPRTRKRKSKVR